MSNVTTKEWKEKKLRKAGLVLKSFVTAVSAKKSWHDTVIRNTCCIILITCSMIMLLLIYILHYLHNCITIYIK